MIRVEVCYALESEQWLLPVWVPEGSTVIKVIMASHILDRFPEIDLTNNVGIFSKKVALGTLVKEGDRIEIYRPLMLTPNQIRLRRATQGGVKYS